MKVLGIIAEFNPFHNGHKYLIEEAKKQTNADCCIIVMSGNFVQRGEIALMDKYARAQIAVENGADIVLELPVHIATASAEGFSHGAVNILNQINIIDTIAFGVERNNIELLDEMADLLINESKEFKTIIKEKCETGLSYAQARSETIISLLPEKSQKEAAQILNSPNSILAIEYLKALKRLNSKITASPILRIGSGYNDNTFSKFSSATGIRQFIELGYDINKCIPENAFYKMNEYAKNKGFLFEQDIFPILMYKLMTLNKEQLSNYIDSNEFIANRIKNNLFDVSSYDELLSSLSTKNYTLTRIKRVLIHILLDLKRNSLKYNDFRDYEADYVKILACKNEKLLSTMCKNSNIPIIVKPSTQIEVLDAKNKIRFENDLKANNIYQGILTAKYNKKPQNEFTQNIFPHKTNG